MRATLNSANIIAIDERYDYPERAHLSRSDLTPTWRYVTT